MSGVKVKLAGWLRRFSKDGVVEVKVSDEGVTVRELIKRLVDILGPDFGSQILDEELHDPRARVLILVDGVEVSALSGLDTRLNRGSEVVLVPFFHGG